MQNLGQLKPAMREAILANARNKVVLQVNAADSGLIAREFGKVVEPEDFTHLQAYEALAQVQTPVGVSNPMSIRTIAPVTRTGTTKAVIERSRARYSRRLADVHAEMESRHITKPTGPRPAIGSI